jgi:hypothetical protein
MSPHPITINNVWALGDTVCLSAFVRDLHLAYPGQYRTALSGNYRSFWENSPHVFRGEQPRGQLYTPEYLEGIRAAGRGVKVHFLSWFHRDFETKFGIKVPVRFPHGDVHLSEKERQDRPFPGLRYWLVNAGGKLDMTAKVWHTARYQAVVDRLAALGVPCVQTGADMRKHFHPRLANCPSAIGKTDSIRKLFSLVYHAEGVVCGITGLMHLAAAFKKPCVVIAGGREEPWWEGYVNSWHDTAFGPKCPPVDPEHRFLHTIGLLDCGVGNLAKGCWRDRAVPVERADLTNARQKEKLCRLPLRLPDQSVPQCMQMIEVDHVVEAVMSYYERGELPPVGPPKGTYRAAGTPAPSNQEQAVAAELGRGKEAPAVPSVPPLPADYPLVDAGGTEIGRALDWLRDAEAPRPIFAGPREFVPAAGEDPGLGLLDHPYLGGKVTAFACCWGDHHALAKRCVDSILETVPARRLDLRVGANQVCDKTRAYLEGFPPGVITKVYYDRGDPNDPKARKKYPCMRQMFWDPECPIVTPYVVWFDDDSWAADKGWLAQLARAVVDNHGHGCRMYGTKFYHDLTPYRSSGYSPERWFRSAPWWTGRPLRVRGNPNLESPNGTVIEFVTGGFWALAAEVLRAADVPDTRLRHNGGDVTIGEQVHQAGFKIKDFSRDKKPVRWSDAKRRGYREDFPWAKITA